MMIFKKLLQVVASNGLWYQKRLHYVAFVTWFFIQCLRKLNYFGNLSTSKTFSSEELYIASLLCHFMGVASTNSVEIASYFIEKGNSGMSCTPPPPQMIHLWGGEDFPDFLDFRKNRELRIFPGKFLFFPGMQ